MPSSTSVASAVLDVEIPGLDKLFIAGEWVGPSTDATYNVISPSLEETVAVVADPAPADGDRAVAAARLAYDEGPWPRMSISERIEACSRLCDAMESRFDDLNRAWAWESGAPLTLGELINDLTSPIVWRRALEA